MWVVRAFFAVAGFVIGCAIGGIVAQYVVTILAVLIPMPAVIIYLIAFLVVIACGLITGYVAAKTLRLFFWRAFIK